MGITSQDRNFHRAYNRDPSTLKEHQMLNQLFDNAYPTKARAFTDGMLTGIVLAMLGKMIYDSFQDEKYWTAEGEPVDVVQSTVIPS
jgi:hypothetical protein